MGWKKIQKGEIRFTYFNFKSRVEVQSPVVAKFLEKTDEYARVKIIHVTSNKSHVDTVKVSKSQYNNSKKGPISTLRYLYNKLRDVEKEKLHDTIKLIFGG